MFQKFFTNTVESKFIQQLLYTTPLPIYPTCREGMYIVAGCTYVYKLKLIRCSTSGILGEGASYSIIGDFTFGVPATKIAAVYRSKNQYYDSETHKILGTYLRCIRDIYDIDLMPFYNCFNGYAINDIILDPTADLGYRIENNTSFNTYAAPIKYNQTYTIAIDCPSDVIIRPVVYGQTRLTKTNTGYYLSDFFAKSTETIIHGTSFKKPFTYCINYSDIANINKTTDNSTVTKPDDKFFADRENYLYLLIQTPSTNKSSVVILEGDYTNVNSRKIFTLPEECDEYTVETVTGATSEKKYTDENKEELTQISDSQLDKLLLSSLHLLNFNDQNIYAFSDTLIEYLLLNAVTSQESIWQNILRAQEILYPTKEKYKTGIWSRKLRKDLFDKCTNNYLANPKFDINGFISKPVKDYLAKLSAENKSEV